MEKVDETFETSLRGVETKMSEKNTNYNVRHDEIG